MDSIALANTLGSDCSYSLLEMIKPKFWVFGWPETTQNIGGRGAMRWMLRIKIQVPLCPLKVPPSTFLVCYGCMEYGKCMDLGFKEPVFETPLYQLPAV